MHADYGTGSFIGVDGAEQTTGDIWGHVLMNAMQLTPGNHEFEALGFDACCDGHAELEVHLPCDTSVDPWRIVIAGEQDCMRCDVPVDGTTCSANTASATSQPSRSCAAHARIAKLPALGRSRSTSPSPA